MPRDLYHLEGQQLRLLQERARMAQFHMGADGYGGAAEVLSLVGSIESTIQQILDDGPQSRDEED